MRWFTKKCLRVHRLMLKASSSTKCSVNSSNHSGRSCDRLPSAASFFSFLFLFSVSVDKQQVFPCSTACTLTSCGRWARRRIFYCKVLRPMLKMYSKSSWKVRLIIPEQRWARIFRVSLYFLTLPQKKTCGFCPLVHS